MGAKLNLIGQQFGRLTVIQSAINKGNRTQWLCRCECGGEYIGTTNALRSGRLSSCGCLRKETAQKNGLKQLNNLVGKKFGLLVVEKYMGSQRKRSSWLCRCQCGNTIIVNQMELTHGDTLSCGCLKSSYGEKKISSLLIEKGISFQKEYSFKDLVSDKQIPLRFDFAIFSGTSLSNLIEYDGEQHFNKKTDSIWSDSLEERKKRDIQKNQYCLKNNIPLYRIPYWEKNNLTFELLTDEKYKVKPS